MEKHTHTHTKCFYTLMWTYRDLLFITFTNPILQFPIGSVNENISDTQYLHLCLLAGQFKIIPPDNPVIGVIGKGVTLPCQLEAKTTPERLFVEWIFIGKSQRIFVTTYDGKNKQNPISEDETYQGRTNFFQTEFNKGNMSLHLKNVMLSDEGKYTCSVFLENLYDEVVVDLNVPDCDCIWYYNVFLLL
uniref:Ig-like domain-containing protein n=1 Tax=Anas platyrhynchos TaxID=8839 RepID=A0A8B9ZFA2_ANAPL